MESSKYWPIRLLFESLNFKYKGYIKIAFFWGDMKLCNLVGRYFYAQLHTSISEDIFLATAVRMLNMTNIMNRTVEFIGWNKRHAVQWNLGDRINGTWCCGIYGRE
jgi:hypothetical protein